MTQVELSNSQRQIVTTLVNKYQQSEEPVKAEAIADAIDRSAGSVRNQMQSLKALDVVAGVPGPAGGYEPTETAFAALGRDDLEEHETVTLSQDFDRVSVTVGRIRFPNVFDAETARAHVYFQQSVPDVDVGDSIAVGPTPLSHLVVAGTVEAVDDAANEVLLDVAVVEAPVTDE